MALDAGNQIVNTNTGLVAEGKDISGGYFSIDALSNIPNYSKITGAMCFVTSEQKFYKYNGTAWQEVQFGQVDDVQVDGVSVVSNKIANITGKQDVIDASHKLSADYISDGITNKTVTQAEKNTWSGKQNLITSTNKLSASLVDDNTSTNKFVTLGDKTTWNNKQNAITSSNKLSADLLADGTTNKLVTQSEKNAWNSKQPAGDYMTLNTDQTATSKKTLSYTEPIVLGGQETILNVLSTHNSEDMDAMWAGRVKIGNRDKTFLLGVYKQAQLGQPAICGIGAHSWEDSFEEVGAAWEDVYLNPDGDKAIYIGDHDWREGTGWFKVQNTGTDYNGKTYCNRGSIQYPDWREVATINDDSLYAENGTWSAYKLTTQFGYKENTSNKVTSISSASTNTQYPSAKLLYDQLALKQGNLTVNPATTSANLTSIGINGTNYALAGGTQVIWRTY